MGELSSPSIEPATGRGGESTASAQADGADAAQTKAASRAMAFGAAVGLTLLLFAAVFSFGWPRYETNDDPAIMRFCSGILTGEPVEFLIFTNVLIGRALGGLYARFPQFNWYSAHLYGVQFVSLCAIAYVLLRRQFSLYSAGLIAVLWLTFGVRFLLLLQYTAVSSVAVAAGVLLLLQCGRAAGGERLAAAIAGVCLAVWGAMIRVDGFFFIFLLGAPLFAFELWRTRSVWPLMSAFAAVLLVIAARAYDAREYAARPEWKTFRDYNAVRGRVHDYGVNKYTDEKKPFYDALGWSENDVALFNGWMFADENLYSEANLRALVRQYGGPQWYHLKSGVFAGRLSQTADVYCALSIVLALAVVLCRPGRWGSAAAAMLGIFLVYWGVLAWFALFRTVPPRVTHPALFFISAAAGSMFLRGERHDVPLFQRALPGRVGAAVRFSVCSQYVAVASGGDHKASGAPVHWRGRFVVRVADVAVWLLRAALLGAVLVAVNVLFQVNEQNRANREAYMGLVATLKNKFARDTPRPVFIDWSDAFPVEWASPFSTFSEYRALGIIPFGWTTHSPPIRELLRKHGISNVYRALYERDDLYTVARTADQARLRTYMDVHLNAEVESREVLSYTLSRSRKNFREVCIMKFFRAQGVEEVGDRSSK